LGDALVESPVRFWLLFIERYIGDTELIVEITLERFR